MRGIFVSDIVKSVLGTKDGIDEILAHDPLTEFSVKL